MNSDKSVVFRIAIFLLLLFPSAHAVPTESLRPVISGEWIQIAGNPDLGAYSNPDQEPVDFAIWEAADGTWQLWSCIRNTDCGGHTRLFHGWEGQSLDQPDWTPRGIMMEAREDLGEAKGGLQAPHVVKWQGQYWMAYGDWTGICFAVSADGKKFDRVIQPDGKTEAFSEGPESNTRDPMLIRIGDLWHCYYTASVDGRGYGFCRTSADMKRWNPSCVVSYGGSVGPGPWQNECPFVVEIERGRFIYFRNQFYGEGAKNWQYLSRNPLNFGIDSDIGLIGHLPVAAPEIIQADGTWHIAALNPKLDGIRIARLSWKRS